MALNEEQVIPEDTRDRAEALLLLARAKIEQSRRGGNETSFWQASYDKALVTGIEHLREAAEVILRESFAGEAPWATQKLGVTSSFVANQTSAGAPFTCLSPTMRACV